MPGAGASSTTKVHGVALAISQHLDLDVPRILEKLLHVDHVVAERGLGLGLGRADGIVQCRLGVHDTHATPATTARSLDDHRITDLARVTRIIVDVIGQGPAGTGYAGHAGGFHCADRFDLVAHHADDFSGRANEDEAGLLDTFGEVGVLAEKAVARMDGLGVGHFRRGDDARDIQVTLAGRSRADTHRLVGHADVFQIAVHRGMHGHRLDAERMAGAQHAERNFAAIGDDDLVEHLGALS